jgi:hypothetical protein
MIKMIAAVARRAGMTHAECVAYHQQVHGAIAREQPLTLRRYVQNHVFDAAFGTRESGASQQSVARDSVTELYWDDFAGMGATFAHPFTQQRVGPDGPNFGDITTTANLVATEVELPVPHPGPGGAKVMHFLRATPGLALGTFFDLWTAAHEHALAEAPAAAAVLRRAAQNRQVPEGNQLLSYFGSSVAPFEGVGSLWFSDESSIGLFRAYEAEMLRFNAQARQAFYVPENSFFVYAREVLIL